MADLNEAFDVPGDLDPEIEVTKKGKKGAAPTAKVDREFYTIVIEEEENQLNYVPVGVNGKVYQIMRGVEVEVPRAVLSVLEKSKATRLVKEVGSDGKAIYVERDYATIPYRVLR